jgi:hypothetical protein
VRIVRVLAAFVALGTVAIAVGDFASHPNALGAVGLILLVVVFALLLAYLFRPSGERARPAPEPPPEEPPRRRAAPSAGVWAEGWDASEAERAKQRRR